MGDTFTTGADRVYQMRETTIEPSAPSSLSGGERPPDDLTASQDPAINHGYVPSELAAGLVTAQAAVESAELDGTSGQSRTRYASRESIARAAKHALSAGGLAFFALHTSEESGALGPALVVQYALVHESGESIIITSGVPMGDSGRMSAEQRRGSAESYCYKYALLSLLNIPRADDEHYESQRPDRQRTEEAPKKTDLTPEERLLAMAQARSLLRADPHWQRSDDPSVVQAGRRREGQLKTIMGRLPTGDRAELLERYRGKERTRQEVWSRYKEIRASIGDDETQAALGSIPDPSSEDMGFDEWLGIVQRLEAYIMEAEEAASVKE